MNKDEKLKVFESLLKSGNPLMIKTGSSKALNIKPAHMSGERGFLCKADSAEDDVTLTGNEVFVSFSVDEESYFFQSKCLKSAGHLGINFQGPLFQLQQRQNARLKIPEYFSGGIAITKHNNDIIEHHGFIEDISLGGCKCFFLDYPQNLIKGDVIDIKVYLPDKTNFELVAKIMSVKFEAINEVQKKSMLGLKFEMDEIQALSYELFFMEIQQALVKSHIPEEYN